MKSLICILLVVTAPFSLAKAAAADFLGQQTIVYSASQPEEILSKTLSNLKQVFVNYTPEFDPSTKIVAPYQVGGTAPAPVITVTIHKCVTFLCETVALYAEIGLSQVRGNCAQNFTVVADFKKSGRVLKDNYSTLNFAICYNAQRQSAKIDIQAWAVRAPSYSNGIIQQQVFDILHEQIAPIASALEQTLKQNGASLAQSSQ